MRLSFNWSRKSLPLSPGSSKAEMTRDLSKLKLTLMPIANGKRTDKTLALSLTALLMTSCAAHPTECAWSVQCPSQEVLELLPYNGEVSHDKKVRKVKEACALQNRGYARHCK